MKRMPSITAPPPLKEAKATVISGEAEEQSQHALTMAIASAEAAVAAAQAAAEVVRIAGIPESSNQCEEKCEESEAVAARNDDGFEYTYQRLRESRESAAIKIQTAFRAYLVSFFDLKQLEFFLHYGYFLMLNGV